MAAHSPIIRPATTADARTIADHNRALCLETARKELDSATVLEGVTRFIEEPKYGRYFLAEQDGNIIGQAAHTYEWSDWRNGELWWIQSVYVHPAHRGKGVFQSLFHHIEQLGKSDSACRGIRLYMERDNDTARRSYLNLGFRYTGYEVLERLW